MGLMEVIVFILEMRQVRSDKKVSIGSVVIMRMTTCNEPREYDGWYNFCIKKTAEGDGF